MDIVVEKYGGSSLDTALTGPQVGILTEGALDDAKISIQ